MWLSPVSVSNLCRSIFSSSGSSPTYPIWVSAYHQTSYGFLTWTRPHCWETSPRTLQNGIGACLLGSAELIFLRWKSFLGSSLTLRCYRSKLPTSFLRSIRTLITRFIWAIRGHGYDRCFWLILRNMVERVSLTSSFTTPPHTVPILWIGVAIEMRKDGCPRNRPCGPSLFRASHEYILGFPAQRGLTPSQDRQYERPPFCRLQTFLPFHPLWRQC